MQVHHCCVIGGSGFIGHHLVDILNQQARLLTVIGRNPAPSRELPAGVRYIPGDYGDRTFLCKALQGVDGIIDLAYASVPKTSFEDPVDDIVHNLPSCVNLFEAAGLFPIKKIVVVSSGGTIYGKALHLPIREDHPTNPISPYGITKLAIEKYARMYHLLKDLAVVCVRPGNAFGEGQIPFRGQGFVATAIASALKDQEIQLFGQQGAIRDYVYVKDLARGIALALDHGTPGECYNLGTGIGTSTQQIVAMLAAMAKSRNIALRVKVLSPRQYDVPANVLDSSKFRRATGWSAAVSLAEGLELTWKYFEKQGRLISAIRK